MKLRLKSLALVATALSGISASALADYVHNDEVIVVGSICVGVDCVNGESFNYDTIRMKENNLRIKFHDSSSSSSFPRIDWQITVNDSTNGGKNYYAIENIDTGKKAFMIESGSDDYSLFVRDNDWVGFKTNVPSVTLQVTTGNSPTLRLEQDGSAGFAAQSWDVAGNETNFFIRDASSAGNLPLRIRAGAPTGSFYVDLDGDIGFGTITPDGILDLASPSDANNHAVLVDSAGQFGINIDNGQSITKQFEIQSSGGKSEFSVASDGNTLIDGTLGVTGATTITGATAITGDTTITGNLALNSNAYVNSGGFIGVNNNNDFTNILGVTPLFKAQANGAVHGSLQFENSDPNYTSGFMFTKAGVMQWFFSSRNDFGSGNGAFYVLDAGANTPVMALFQDKTIGLGGVQVPTSGRAIHHISGAYLSDTGNWMNSSSREKKENIHTLTTEQASNTLEKLEPVTYNYKVSPDDDYVGFIAEDVPDLVATVDRKSLSSMDIVAVLTKVVKDQQQTIKKQKEMVEALNKRMEAIEESR